MGKAEQANKRRGLFCDWFGEHIWLSPIGPELEAGAKIREAGSQRLSPGGSEFCGQIWSSQVLLYIQSFIIHSNLVTWCMTYTDISTR